MKKFLLILVLFYSVSSGLAAVKSKPVWLDTSRSFEERAWSLVDEMTLEEKVGQMMNDAPAIKRLDIPAYDWWNEALHGVARSGFATVFPQAIGMAATFDRQQMFQTADIISTEGRAKYHEAVRNNIHRIYYGLTFWSPNINIFRDPRWGRGQETYGEDPYLTGQMGMEFVKGLQGSDPKYFKTVATPKHFAVHSGPEPERHKFDAVPCKRDLYETYLPAFEDLIVRAKAYSIMGAYNSVDGESASASQLLLQDILRNKWGFEGFVVSDCGAIGDIWQHHKIVATAAEAAALGARRGCDLNCGGTYAALVEAVKLGYIDEAEIDLNIYRLIMAKMKLGMFDPDDMVEYSQIPYSINDSAEHSAAALAMARKSIVLLKNQNETLPLDKAKIKTIAVVGPNADNIDSLLGNYNGTPSTPVTVLAGIEKEAGQNIKVIYAQGCDLAEGFVDINQPDLEKPVFKTDRSGATDGLTARYYNNIRLQGEPVLVRVENDINYDWQILSPVEKELSQGILSRDKAVNRDNISVSWSGVLVAPDRADAKMLVGSDDGIRVYIDDKLVFEDWTTHAFRIKTIAPELTPGQSYDFKVEYFEGQSEARVMVGWEAAGQKSDSKFEEALELARSADVVVYVGGLTAQIEGEEMPVNYPGFAGGDRTDISLPAPQQKMLEALQATGKPVVFVMLTGSAIACPWVQDNISAIVCGWYPGQSGGTAVADVLFGKYNPAGRLPVTFYNSTDQLGSFEDYNMDGKTYRYFKGQPQYAFGFGLSYTNFAYDSLKVSKKKAAAADKIEVSFRVTNTGKVDGDEVVQLYVRDVESDLVMPIKQLRGFERIHLKAGESKKVKMYIKPENDMRYYEPRQEKFTVEPGDFEIQIGSASDNIRLRQIITVK